ncbi:DUF1028 domain-containing protein [Mucilaginibacter sp. NFX135]|uniref:DUF1028 domain-containing protein n=1 Tax=Mucilaginibacter sp. NFX135 TaxID=3402687 RepID=UPI003AFA101F
MPVKSLICLFSILSLSVCGRAQNLPSLVLNRNINSTFSIIAYDPQAQEWGIAVATNNIYVGNSTCYIRPGMGAFSVIAETEPMYAYNGFDQLKAGKTIEQAIQYTQMKDTLADYRQVSGIDAKGNVYAFTGSSLKYWKGKSVQLTGKYYAVMGNQLKPNVLHDMASTFEHTKGTLAVRLLKALVAGENAGGQISGKQSAALLVKGSHNEWFNQIDLRVDHSKDPFADLQKLLNYHYGRILINQANYAISIGNKKHGEGLLKQAVGRTKGWYGIYPKIAKTYLLLGQDKTAIKLIKAAVRNEPKWRENVSAFYCLYHDPAISSLYPVKQFTVIDWNNAISMLIDLNHLQESITLSKTVIGRYPSSSYTWYLQAKAYESLRDLDKARTADMTSLKIDPENADAKRLLTELNH